MMMVVLMVIAPPVGLHLFWSYHGIEAGVVLWVKICDINNVVSVSITYRLHKKTKEDTAQNEKNHEINYEVAF